MPEPEPPPARLASDPRKPRFALIAIPAGIISGDRPEAEAFRAGYRDLIARLPAATQLLVGCHRRGVTEVSRWLEARVTPPVLVPLDDALDFSLWSQDVALAAEDSGRAAVLLISEKPLRAPDAVAVEAIAAAAGIAVRRIPARAEAGNLLVLDDRLLVGADVPEEGIEALAGGRSLARVGVASDLPHRRVRLERIEGRLWIDEVFAGAGRRQPVFHLDMFLTPAGRDADGWPRLLVGDMRMADALRDGQRPPADLGIIADALDEVAEGLRRHGGFTIIRNPMPLVAAEEGGLLAWSRASVAREFAGIAGVDEVLAAMDADSLRRIGVRRWHVATQNNALTFADGEGAPTVLLPTYAHGKRRGLAACERRNAAIWEELGYRVSALADFSAFVRRHGSARCTTKLFG